ncbi:MAG: hemolysin III family protein [Gemmatimonadota bacterium]|nr:hemolysin III family protein [Gemmatimonadota bacterium]
MDDSATSREEIANSLSHGFGLLGALAATPILIIAAASRGDTADVVGSSIFGLTMVLLYLASTFYHAAPVGRLKDRLQRLDHAAIYLLIAGTYTPFTLGVLAGPWGWTLFGLVWGTAVFGVSFKLLAGVRYPRLSTSAYVIMGWLALIAIRPLVVNMPTAGLLWLVAGGLSYSGGVAFYSARRLPYSHFMWHLCVLAGTVCHFFAVLWYAS